MQRVAFYLRLGLLAVLLTGLLFQPQTPAYALTTLTVEQITWDVIGLDSNNVNVGPNDFPVGVRVCNTGAEAATTVTATWNWDSANPYINLRPGTLSSINLGTLNPGECADAYFEVQITRDAAAYDTTREYHVDVTAGNVTGTISTPQPRELYVEHLVSQSRNAVTDMKLDGISIAAGGTMTLMVGQTYTIELDGYTATQGYEQIEYFINFPNTIFQILSVSSTFTADTSATVSSPMDKLYGNGCVWEDDPNSPNYRSCLATGKTGGTVSTTYVVKILQIPGAPLVNPEPLSTLIYDFSGSSFHYNSDYDVSTRYAYIVDPTVITIAKNFSPDPTSAGGTSVLSFTITNPTGGTITGVNFTDTLPTTPGAMTVASTPNAGTSGCGAATFNPVPGAGSISFADGTIAPNSSCVITLNVFVSDTPTPLTFPYIDTNTTNNLFVFDTVDTGNSATDTIEVIDAPVPPSPPSSCVSPRILAQWDMGTGVPVVPTDPPAYSFKETNVATATASFFSSGTGSATINTTVGNPANGWGATGDGWVEAPGDSNNYFQFDIDTSNYGGVYVVFDVMLIGNGDWASPNSNIFVKSSADGGAYSTPYEVSPGVYPQAAKSNGGTITSITAPATVTGSTTTAFRFSSDGGSKAAATFVIDNVTFYGCQIPEPPILAKAFAPDPIAVGGTSTLTFTITNPNPGPDANYDFTGINLTDDLPTGVEIATAGFATNTCGFTGTAPAVTDTSLSLNGGSLTSAATPSSCEVSVEVTATTAGPHANVSGFISATETGPNNTDTGYGTDTLTAILPPSIEKAFAPNPILEGGVSTLTFTITNPNQDYALTNVSFGDTFPTSPDNMVVAPTPNVTASASCGTPTYTISAGDGSVSFSGMTISGGEICYVTVDVTAPTAGDYANTSNAVTADITGGTDTASDTLTVNLPNPDINILKQVGAANTGPWTSFLTAAIGSDVYYKFTIENTGDVALSNVTINDPTLTGEESCSWVDGDGTVLGAAPISLPVADANDNQIATCVIGPFTAVTGSHTNTATASGTNGSTVTKSSSATYGTPALTLVKGVKQTSFTSAGDILEYSYVVANTGSAPLLGPVTVSDDKIVAPNPVTTVTCPAVSTAVQTSPPGLGDGDDWLDPGESITCVAFYTVVAGDVTAGSVTNNATATADGVDSNTDSQTVYRIPDFTVSKTNSVSGSASGAVAVNASFNWTITVSQISTGQGSFTDTQTILSDTLPGTDAYYTLGALTVTLGATAPTGTINCSIVSGPSLSCVASGTVTFPSGSSFSVTFGVTPTAAGSLSNTATVDPNAVITELDETNNASTNIVAVVASPSISKSFSPNPVVANVNSTLTFTLSNSNVTTDLTGVTFADTYPTGLVNATPLTTSNTCGGALTAVAGGGGLSLSGGTITANSTCTITVDVVAATGGSYANTTGTVSSTNGGNGNTGSSTLNVFDASPAKSIVTTSEASTGIVSGIERVTIGEMIRYRLATLIPEGSFTNVQLVDGLPTGLQFLDDGTATVAFVCNGSANCMTSSTLSGAGLVISGSSSVVSPTFAIPGSAISGGPFGSGTNVTFSVGDITNSDVDADSEYVVIEFNALVLNVNSSVTINQGVDNDPASLTAGQSNINNRQNDVTLLVNGTQVGTTSPNVTVDIAEPAITSITKSVSPATGPYLPGDAITYSLVFTNNATGNNAATAFDISLTDTFDSNLTLGTVTASTAATTQGATCAGGTAFSANGSTAGQTVTINVSCLDPGQSVTATIAATINSSATGTINNSAGLTYTSLPGTQGSCAAAPFTCTGVGTGGSGTGERDGSGGIGADGTVLNNYAVASNIVGITVTPQTPSLTVTKSSTTTSLTAPGTVNYSYLVTNTGNVALTGISLSDDNDNNDMSCPATILAAGANMTCTASHTFTQAELDANGSPTGGSGNLTNTVTASSNEASDATDTLDIPITPISSIALTKTGTLNDDDGTPGLSAGDTISYAFTVQNTGNVALTNITLADTVGGVTISGGPIASLLPGASDTTTFTGTYTLTQTDINAGSFMNTATVTGTPPTGPDVTGTDSDTQDFSGALVADPAISKAGDPTQATVGETVTFTLTVTNHGNTPASNVVITDVLPAQFDVTAVNLSGAPSGTLINVTPPTGTGSAPYTVVVTLGADLGVSDVVKISIVTIVNSLGNPPTTNTASLTTSSTTNIISNDSGSVTIDIKAPTLGLPATGFAPNVVSELPYQPREKNYAATDLILEIPRLGVRIPIVGVPLTGKGWDVTWLSNQTGWLEGTAFPSWSGNSVLTGHVYLSNGLPGPFVYLNYLKYGDQIIIHAYGQKYIFEVVTSDIVQPNDVSAFKHEDKPWVTLITCREYDQKTNTYKKRVVVQAVLVQVAWDK